MIYLFYGSDVEKARKKAFDWVRAAQKKEPQLAYVRLAREELSDATLADAAQAGGLFVRRLLILIDDPYAGMRDFVNPSPDDGFTKSEHGPAEDILEDHLDALADSDNAIVILAPRLSAPRAKKLVVKAKQVYTFDLPSARLPAGRQGFNANLVNALASRSRERLWLEVVRALRQGDAPEMLHGLLHWKARDLMEKGSRSWTASESRQLSMALISLLQDSRRKGLDLSESLERFALSI